MKNKISLRKLIIQSICIIFLIIIIFSRILYKQYKTYTYNFNNKIYSISNKVLEKYPNIEKRELIEILNDSNNRNNSNDDLFREYGIDFENDSVILENDKVFYRFLILDISILLIFILISTFILGKYKYNEKKKIEEIIKYIEEINKGNYKLDIEDNSEDELSILKNELYKTTVMLNEVAESSVADKVSLKNSLSDISHQLKTPLTSIIIMIENIENDENMDKKVRKEFMNDIKREIVNLKFLVEALLKLSKFESNSITFIEKEVFIKDIIDESIKNVEMIGELRNIKINIKSNNKDKLICDMKWQVEAITNIIKNCIEHSSLNGKINIKYEQNKVYSEIEIRDFGTGIAKKDLPHIFERFYKGKNSSQESIGIGLALAKSIVEKSNGYIEVSSEIGKGTIFKVRYLK